MHRRRTPRPFFYARLAAIPALALSVFLLGAASMLAQSAPTGELAQVAPAQTPLFWYVLAAGLALLVPAGLVLISVAEMDPRHAWHAALGALAAIGVVTVGYWAFGFALQFGGVGLIYTRPELSQMVWEWSLLSSEWGGGWGMAGLSGWFLSGPDVTAMSYALFLAHLPWALTAAIIPVVALRDRAPSIATVFLAFVVGAIIYPLAGNWVQGGGWLSGLGRNLNLGHGLIDFGGAGAVFLVAAGFALAALVVWPASRSAKSPAGPDLPPAQLPLLAVVGALFALTGVLGWMWSNPLQVETLTDVALMRGSINIILAAGGGALVPLLYTWFVAGYSHPTLSARGLVAGLVAGLAAGPFVQPGPAFLLGLIAGATVPFVTYFMDRVLRLDDRTGVISMIGIPAMLGLLLTGVLADGVMGQGWQMTGLDRYLGVTGQGVTGLLAAAGRQMDFPGQFQAQLIGVIALGLLGFLSGLIVCAPLGLLLHGLQRDDRRARRAQSETSAPTAQPQQSAASSTPQPQSRSQPKRGQAALPFQRGSAPRSAPQSTDHQPTSA
jgi:Amt family ammonium transporter